MASSATIARHRGDVQQSPLSTIARAVSSNAGSMGRQAAVVAAASGMVLATGVSAQAAVDREASAASALQIQTPSTLEVSAPVAAKVSFDRPDVRSSAAPVEQAPEPVTAPQSNDIEPAVEPAVDTSAEPEAPAEPAAQTGTTASTSSAPAQQSSGSPAPSDEQQAPSSSGVAAGIASAAYAQLGVSQDCTMLVTNALAAVGINHHGWPDSYFSLGSQVSASQAQPGDLVYYADGGTGMAHIAVYVGNGQAIHGGWEGGQTVLASVNVGSGPVYIHVNG